MFHIKRKSRRESGRLRYMAKIRSKGILVIDVEIRMEGGACGPPSRSNDLLRTQIRWSSWSHYSVEEGLVIPKSGRRLGGHVTFVETNNFGWCITRTVISIDIGICISIVWWVWWTLPWSYRRARGDWITSALHIKKRDRAYKKSWTGAYPRRK